MPDEKWNVRIAIIGSLLVIGAIIAGLWAMNISLGYSKGFHQGEAKNYAEQYPSDTDKRIDRCPTDNKDALKACVEEAISASHDAQRAERDLGAQRDMADWAFWLLIVSVVTLFISGFGLWALLRTIWQGHEANQIASQSTDWSARAAEAASRANVISQESLERQFALTQAAQRAWIIVEPRIVAGRSDTNGFAIEWRVDFRNIGQTMAHDIHYRAIAEPVGYPDAIEEIGELLVEIQSAKDYATGSIIPGEHVWLGVKSKRRFNELPWDEEGRCFFMIVARAEYKIEGSKEIHVTARAFAVGFKDKSMFRERTIEKAVDTSAGFSAKRLSIFNFGPTIST